MKGGRERERERERERNRREKARYTSRALYQSTTCINTTVSHIREWHCIVIRW